MSQSILAAWALVGGLPNQSKVAVPPLSKAFTHPGTFGRSHFARGGLPGCGGHWFRAEVLVGFLSPLGYHQQRRLGVTVGVLLNRTGLSSCWLLWHSHGQTGGSVSTCVPLAGIP